MGAEDLRPHQNQTLNLILNLKQADGGVALVLGLAGRV